MQDRGRWIALFLFAVAMAYLEATVVVYLREIFYPGRPALFPLAPMVPRLYLVELGREAATLVMLVTVAWAVARSGWQRFFRFMVLFGVWDLFYYFWLFVLIRWPRSLLEWDVLFLIPIPWFGPVLTPMLVALLLVVAGLIYDERLLKGWEPVLDLRTALPALLGVLLVLVSFMGLPAQVLARSGPEGFQSFVPDQFLWSLYVPGFFLMAAAAALFLRSFRPPTGSTT